MMYARTVLSAFAAAALVAAPHLLVAADIYVDSSSGGGDGTSAATAFPTIRAAVAAASAGDTIWVKGSFTVAGEADTIPIPDTLEGLSIRGYETTPGDGGRASVTISDSYAANASGIHVISNAAENVTVGGLDFAFEAKGLKRSSSIFATTAGFSTVEDCDFRMASPASSSDGNNAILINGLHHTATNMTVRGCGFYNTRCWKPDWPCLPIFFLANATIAENVFSNVCHICASRQNDSDGSGRNLNTANVLIVSNLVYAANNHQQTYAGVNRIVYNGQASAEIAYNRFIVKEDAYTSSAEKANERISHYAWLGLCGGSSQVFHAPMPSKDASLIHHNTFVGGETALLIYANAAGTTRKNRIFSNLFLLNEDGTNIVENLTTALNNGRTTTFVSPSTFENNAYRTAAIAGGTPASGVDWDITTGLTIVNNISLAAMPQFVNTDDIYSDNYYRYKASEYPALATGGWTGENKEYPAYIGALEPLGLKRLGLAIVVR